MAREPAWANSSVFSLISSCLRPGTGLHSLFALSSSVLPVFICVSGPRRRQEENESRYRCSLPLKSPRLHISLNSFQLSGLSLSLFTSRCRCPSRTQTSPLQTRRVHLWAHPVEVTTRFLFCFLSYLILDYLWWRCCRATTRIIRFVDTRSIQVKRILSESITRASVQRSQKLVCSCVLSFECFLFFSGAVLHKPFKRAKSRWKNCTCNPVQVS